MTFSTGMLVVAVLTLSFPAAAGENIDFSAIRCKDFIAADGVVIGNIMSWLEGYYTKENDPPILYRDKMVNDAKKLAIYCGQHGDAGLITAAEAVMPVQ